MPDDGEEGGEDEEEEEAPAQPNGKLVEVSDSEYDYYEEDEEGEDE